ncbi:MAG: hypothetical protein IJO08_02245 [Clostridia bacterium]|nr:hypothetical protein [Clostridia bacterium]
MSELIVNKCDSEVNICILENNMICELYTAEAEVKNIMGNIYIGKVVNVVDGMQAAFVDIGNEKNAFISIKDALPKVDLVKETQVIDSKISEVLKVRRKDNCPSKENTDSRKRCKGFYTYNNSRKLCCFNAEHKYCYNFSKNKFR